MTDHDSMPSAEFMHRVLAAFAFDNCDMLFWRVDGEYAPVTFFAQANDVFWWGTADVEKIEPGDLPLLEQVVADLAGIGHQEYLAELYAAGKRRMRPQGAYYRNLPPAVSSLFDACGPERAPDIANPEPQPSATDA